MPDYDLIPHAKISGEPVRKVDFDVDGETRAILSVSHDERFDILTVDVGWAENVVFSVNGRPIVRYHDQGGDGNPCAYTLIGAALGGTCAECGEEADAERGDLIPQGFTEVHETCQMPEFTNLNEKGKAQAARDVLAWGGFKEYGTVGGFTEKLIEAGMHADIENRQSLAIGFPELMWAVNTYKNVGVEALIEEAKKL